MKKLLVLTLMFIFVIGSTSFAQDLEGKMKASGYLGYTIGFGDAFSGPLDAGFNFGGTFHYGIKENLMIGGELGLQSYDYGVGSDTKVNLIGSVLYPLNYTDEKAFYLTGGLGLYGGTDNGLGINGGIVYSFQVAESIQIYGMPRLHIVFVDSTPMMLSLSAGAFFDFGDKY